MKYGLLPRRVFLLLLVTAVQADEPSRYSTDFQIQKDAWACLKVRSRPIHKKTKWYSPEGACYGTA